MGKKIEEKIPSEKLPIETILKKHNLSIDDLVRCGKEGLTATKESSSYNEDGEKIDIPDYHVRHKYFESFLTMLQILKPTSVSVQMVNISTEEKELLEAYKRVPNV